MATRKNKSLIPAERIENSILVIRGQKVMLDADLAEIYGVTTKRLNEQVRRNVDRFPKDFAFRLSSQELNDLRSQFAATKWSKRRSPPYAFTEHGALMAASVLNTPVAVETSVHVVRTFVRLRTVIATHKDLARKLATLENKYDAQFKVVFQAIRQLMAPPTEDQKKRRIGFRRPEGDE